MCGELHKSWLYCVLDNRKQPKALMRIFDCCKNANIIAPKVSRTNDGKIQLTWKDNPYMGFTCGVQFTFGDDNIIHYMWYASNSFGSNHDSADERTGEFELNKDYSALTSSIPFKVLDQYFSTNYNYR